jgi:two-component system chemotaxis response regulator CheB
MTSSSTKIRVLIVEDSPVAVALLKRELAKAPDIEVVGTARNGREALELIPALNPAVVCTDFHMPVMDGLELTREILARHPLPILVLSVSVVDGSVNVFNLLNAGALDVVSKPNLESESTYAALSSQLANKIRILSGVRVFRRLKRPEPGTAPPGKPLLFPDLKSPVRLVVIGASTGGPQALQTILNQLPLGFSLPVVCVQHISEGFLDGLVQWLNDSSPLDVRIARSGDTPTPGTVSFPQEGTHLAFDDRGRFLLSHGQPVCGHRPSVTMTMNSAAERYGGTVVGVILTGMGSDGADGMADIIKAGGLTIAQDEASSMIFGMPRQAIERGAVLHILPLCDIAPALVRLQNYTTGTGVAG